MRQRITGKNSRVSIDPSKKSRITERLGRAYEDGKIREEYRRKKKEDKDTNERQSIHGAIIALVGYEFPVEEAVKKLEELLPDSKYKTFFESWIKDRYEKMKPVDTTREDDLSL